RTRTEYELFRTGRRPERDLMTSQFDLRGLLTGRLAAGQWVTHGQVRDHLGADGRHDRVAKLHHGHHVRRGIHERPILARYVQSDGPETLLCGEGQRFSPRRLGAPCVAWRADKTHNNVIVLQPTGSPWVMNDGDPAVGIER